MDKQNKAEKPPPKMCLHCGDVLCVATQGCAHYIALLHHQTGGRVNKYCTRAKLVEVKGCEDCFRRRYIEDLQAWRCQIDPRPGGASFLISGDYRSPPIGFPSECPLLDKDGKPNAGVKIVASANKGQQ